MIKTPPFPIGKSVQMVVWGITFIFLLAYTGWSQQIINYATNPSPEKIYLQLDSKVYTKDQTIWFKSIVTDAGTHVPTKKSGVLHVELIGPTETILEKKLIKIENGIGDGFFSLNEKYDEGLYQVRAYTKWNLNFDLDLSFQSYIQVFSTSQKEQANPISNITLIEKDDNKRFLQAHFDLLSMEPPNSKKIKLILTINEKKDTLNIKKGNDDTYLLNYEIPDKCNYVGLQIQTENHINYSRTIVLDEEYLDLQFFPESGELVHGLKSKVGFKALAVNGKGKYIEGEIVTQDGKLVTQFKSNLLGMGSFVIPIVDSTQTYTARLTPQSEQNSSKSYSLPAVVRRGNILSVTKQENKIQILAASNYLKQDSIYFRASCRGIGYFAIKGRLTNGRLMFALPVNSLPEGVIALTMMDKSGQSIAERLFFNVRPESRMNISISTDKESYVQRELTTLNIETANHKKEAISANLSVLVLNNEQLGQLQNTREHILSYFLLSSDLKGEIENPRFYLNKDSESHLDALMLTQGWRRYNYTKPIDIIHHQPEPSLSITGYVEGGLLMRKKKEVHLTLVTMGNPQSFQSQTIDSLRKFKFQIPDEFGEDLYIIMQSADKYGQARNYAIELDTTVSPSIAFDHSKDIVKVDSTIQELIQKNMMRKKIKDAFNVSEEGITLEEVVIEGYRMTPERERVIKKFGKARVIISGKEIQEKEENWSSGLFSVLMFHYSDKIKIVRRGNNLYARVIGSPSIEPGDGVTLIVVDGILVKEEEYQLIPAIPPSEVKSIEIIQSAKNFKQHYLEVDVGANVLDAPSFGSVIAIYTHAGKGLHNVRRPTGLLHATVPVFAEPREFYAPKYANASENNWAKPDLRALVHWEPQIEIDSFGKGTISFYNADNPGKMIIIVEAISDKGEIGYQKLFFNVEKNTTNN